MHLNWHIHGHANVLESIERDFLANSIPNTILLTGPAHIGKFSLLKKLAELMQEDEHHIIDTFSFERENNDLGIKEFRELKHNLSLSPQRKYKIVVIQDIERLSLPLQNAMLKILEEPPEYVYFLLTSSNPEDILETIVSRCRVYRTGPATDLEVANYLEHSFKELNPKFKEDIIFFSSGRIGLANNLVNDEEKYQNMINWLAEIRHLYSHGQPHECLKFAEKIAEIERSSIEEFMFVLIQFLRSEKAANHLIFVQNTYEAILNNANIKIALEVLFLRIFKGMV
jgi:DNA polymerase-3 subunit delta'